jgi:hypothetical protein
VSESSHIKIFGNIILSFLNASVDIVEPSFEVLEIVAQNRPVVEQIRISIIDEITAIQFVHCSNDCRLTSLLSFRTFLYFYCIIRLSDERDSDVDIWLDFVRKYLFCLFEVFNCVTIATLLSLDDALTQVLIESADIILHLIIKAFVFIDGFLVLTGAKIAVCFEFTK